MRRKGVNLLRLIFTGRCLKSQNKPPSSRSPSSSRKRHRPESTTQTRSVTRSVTEHEHDSVTETTAHSRSPTHQQQQKNTPNQLKNVPNPLHEVHDLEVMQDKVKSLRDIPSQGFTAGATVKGYDVRPVYGHGHGHGWTPLGDAESFKDQNITILGVSEYHCVYKYEYVCECTYVYVYDYERQHVFKYEYECTYEYENEYEYQFEFRNKRNVRYLHERSIYGLVTCN